MIDKYCLECGESVEMEATSCHYCGSEQLDIMDIDEL
ncbi:zinc-ribbon domain-containing protein [Geobacillus thermodenitrificans]|jgi:ribosomal protein L40E